MRPSQETNVRIHEILRLPHLLLFAFPSFGLHFKQFFHRDSIFINFFVDFALRLPRDETVKLFCSFGRHAWPRELRIALEFVISWQVHLLCRLPDKTTGRFDLEVIIALVVGVVTSLLVIHEAAHTQVMLLS